MVAKLCNILFVLLIAFNSLFAQTVTKATLDTTAILLGEQIYLNLEVDTHKDIFVGWPLVNDTLSKHIEILSKSTIDTTMLNDEIVHMQQKLLITSFDSGYYEIPKLKFIYRQTGEESFELSYTDVLYLTVNSVSVDTTMAIKPIKGPIKQAYTFREIAPFAFGGLALIALIMFLNYYIKKRKKQEPVFKTKSKLHIPAHVLALNQLDELKNKKLWQNDKFKEYYSELTDILRIYLDNRFKLEAMEMTSDEINEAVAEIAEIDKTLQNKLKSILITADLAKFAKSRPLPIDNDNNLIQVKEFIEKTIKKIVEEEKLSAESKSERSENSLLEKNTKKDV